MASVHSRNSFMVMASAIMAGASMPGADLPFMPRSRGLGGRKKTPFRDNPKFKMYKPHQGAAECARRRRQIAKGMIRCD